MIFKQVQVSPNVEGVSLVFCKADKHVCENVCMVGGCEDYVGVTVPRDEAYRLAQGIQQTLYRMGFKPPENV